MHVEEMANRILQVINNQGGAMFFQLTDAIGPEAYGRTVLLLPEFPNVVLWTDVSDTFAEAFNAILDRLEVRRANSMAYAFLNDDTGFPHLPIVTPEQWRDRDLKFDNPWPSRHWLPLIFFVKAQTAVDTISVETEYGKAA